MTESNGYIMHSGGGGRDPRVYERPNTKSGIIAMLCRIPGIEEATIVGEEPDPFYEAWISGPNRTPVNSYTLERAAEWIRMFCPASLVLRVLNAPHR